MLIAALGGACGGKEIPASPWQGSRTPETGRVAWPEPSDASAQPKSSESTTTTTTTTTEVTTTESSDAAEDSDESSEESGEL